MEPLLPDYGGGSLPAVVPALLGRRNGVPAWMPDPVAAADQVVLLVLDGLGWAQLQERAHLAPTLTGLVGGAITSVAPSSTVVALTSIALGQPPARHGIVGYRLHVGRGKVLNLLRWRTSDGDASETIPAEDLVDDVPFEGTAPPVITRSEFSGTGFTALHLAGTRLLGWRMPSSIPVEVGRLLDAGEPFVYAYYDGVDKVAHERGFGPHYDAEVVAADRLVADVVAVLPPGAALVVTADHGQVDVGDALRPLDDDLLADVDFMSGEGRFRWLHARPGTAARLAERAAERLEREAWVRTPEQLDAEGWFGGPLSPKVATRLGDVALVPHAAVAFPDPADPGENRLRCRHGSLTAEEMLVPLVAYRA